MTDVTPGPEDPPEPPPPPPPRLEPHERHNPAPRWLFPALLAAVLLPRLLVFGVNENLYGDAVARTDLAARWAAAPHWIESFQDGAQQYGPLHIMLIGAALLVDPDAARAGRWVSLLFGVLTVWPLFSLTRRYFGWRAGAWACLALAVWGLHIQCATTAASEAVTLFFLLAAFAFVAKAREPGRIAPLVWAALCMNVAAALRYDPWLLMPVVGALFLLGAEDRAAGFARFALFGLLCLPVPLLWIHGNELWSGDPLFPIRFTDAYHHTWAREELTWTSEADFRLRGLWFWPASALFTLTPLLGGLGTIGMVSAYRRQPATRWLLWLMVAPTAYYAFRIVVQANFVPLARFAVPQIALLLPFVFCGAQTVARLLRTNATAIATVALVTGVVFTTWLGWFTFDRPGVWEETLLPVSPVSRNPPQVRQLAEALRSHRGASAVVLDAVPGFWDLQLAALARVPEPARVPVRWETFDAEYASKRPGWVFAAQDGALRSRPGWQVTPERVIAPDGTLFVAREARRDLTLYERSLSQP